MDIISDRIAFDVRFVLSILGTPDGIVSRVRSRPATVGTMVSLCSNYSGRISTIVGGWPPRKSLAKARTFPYLRVALANEGVEN